MGRPAALRLYSYSSNAFRLLTAKDLQEAFQHENMQVELSGYNDLLTERHRFLLDSGQMGTVLQTQKAKVRQKPCRYLALPGCK